MWLSSSVSLQECFESLLSILHWSWTTLVLGVEELRGLKGFQYTATLLDLERLRFVGTCCLRLLRVYICEIFPIAGRNTEKFSAVSQWQYSELQKQSTVYIMTWNLNSVWIFFFLFICECLSLYIYIKKKTIDNIYPYILEWKMYVLDFYA